MVTRLFATDDAGSGVDDQALRDQQAADEANADKGGAPGATGETQDQESAPAFDPSKIDVTDTEALAGLSEEQLAQVEEYEKTKAATPPEASPKKDTEAEDTGEKPGGESAEKPTGGAAKYAGKYATIDELIKGVGELAKKVGVPVEAFQPVLDAAKALKQYASIEALYKNLEHVLSEKGAAPSQPASQPAAAPAKDTAATDTFDEADPKVLAAVNQLTLQQIAQSPIAARMAAKGISLPKNMEEFEALTEVNAYFASEFQRTYTELYRANIADAKSYFEAAKTVDSTNAKTTDSDVTAIRKLAEEHGFKVTDAEIDAAKAEALANAGSFEMRSGHKFLREGAVLTRFLHSVLPKKIDEIAVAKQAEGRMQAVRDLDAKKKAEVTAASTMGPGTRGRAVQQMPDLSDPDVVASLPDEALADPDKFFKNFSKK